MDEVGKSTNVMFIVQVTVSHGFDAVFDVPVPAVGKLGATGDFW
jgi:hypothetical protein